MKFQKVFPVGRAPFLGAITFASVLVQFGCAPLRPSPKAGSVSAPAAPVRQEVRPEEKLPGLIVTEIEGKKAPEKLYSFSLRDADIREVLMALSKQTSFNIVVDPDVQGKVTVDLKNMTMTEALDTLTELLDLTYRVKQNVIRVSKPMPETRIFSLQYVNIKRTGSSTTSAQIGTGSTGTTGGTVAGGTTATVGGGSGGGSTSVTSSTDTDLWKDIEAGVTKLLSPSGKVVVDKQSGNILVTDLPKFLDRIGSFLESVEGSVQRQVLIEARIVEVSLTGQYQYGIDWGAVTRAAAMRGASTIAPGKIFAQQLAPSSAGFQIGVASTDFNALLSVLSQQGEVKVISSPKLATLNNQTAVIRAGTDEVFFQTRVQETPSLTGTQTTKTVFPQTVTIGVVLGITPQIGPDGTVILHIHPTVTDKTGEAVSSVGDTFPILSVREADMIVSAKEGQVVVIGGLMQDKKSSTDNKVPILGDLPGIGRLFTGTTQEASKTELVVLLSPTVMVGKKVDEITARELQRLNKLRGGSPW